MGQYINPEGEDKVDFCNRVGLPVSEETVLAFDYTIPQDHLPVCVVDNGSFTAAGIADSAHERARFHYGTNGRPYRWFLLPKSALEPYLRK